MIKINEINIKFKEGMTILDAIIKGKKSINQNTIIMVNNYIIEKDVLDKLQIDDNSEIKILRITDGG